MTEKGLERLSDGTPAKFCTSCQGTRSYEGGKWITAASGTKRWKCGGCIKLSKLQRPPFTPGHR